MTAVGIYVLAKKYDNGENILPAMPPAHPRNPENIPAAFPAWDLSVTLDETRRQIDETIRQSAEARRARQ